MTDVQFSAQRDYVSSTRTVATNPASISRTSAGRSGRAMPDISADALGMVADAQQRQAWGVGFINPLLYAVANSGAYLGTLPVSSSTPELDRGGFVPARLDGGQPLVAVVDDQDPAQADQVTAPGYDTMTLWAHRTETRSSTRWAPAADGRDRRPAGGLIAR